GNKDNKKKKKNDNNKKTPYVEYKKNKTEYKRLISKLITIDDEFTESEYKLDNLYSDYNKIADKLCRLPVSKNDTKIDINDVFKKISEIDSEIVRDIAALRQLEFIQINGMVDDTENKIKILFNSISLEKQKLRVIDDDLSELNKTKIR